MHQKEESEIDLFALVRNLWSKRLFIGKVIGLFIVVGLLIILLSPKEYQTNATLIPEAQNQTGAAGLLQKYGGLLGVSGGDLNLDQQEGIPPALYPQIVQSLPFQLELLNKKVQFTEFDTTATVYDFFDNIYTPSVFSYVAEYTIGLPGKAIGLIKGERRSVQPLPKGFERDSVISVTKEQMKIIDDMRERISVSLNQETGVIDLSAEMPDPHAAAEVGKMSIKLLREYMANYRTHKVKENLKYARQQLVEVKQDFVNAQNRLANFRDSNMNLATAKAQTKEERLQSEYNLAFNVYNTMAQQVEQIKLKVQEQIPVLSILQPVQVPLDDTMSGLMVLILVILAGLVIGIVLALFQIRRQKLVRD